MNIRFRESFRKDLRKIKDKDLLTRVRTIIEAVEQASSLGEILHIEQLKGWPRYYRIRVGDYRIGIALEDDVVTFVRFLHRKDVYRYFP